MCDVCLPRTVEQQQPTANGRIMLNIISFFLGVSYLNIMAAGLLSVYKALRTIKHLITSGAWEGTEGHI